MKMTEKNVELIKEALKHECPCDCCIKKHNCDICCDAKREWTSNYVHPLDANNLTYLWTMLVDLKKRYSDFDRLLDSIAVEIEKTSKYTSLPDVNNLRNLWFMLIDLKKMYSDFDRLIDSTAVEIEETDLIRISQFLYTVGVRDLDKGL